MDNRFELLYEIREDHYFRGAPGSGGDAAVFRVAHEVWAPGSLYDADGLSVLTLMLIGKGGGRWALGGAAGELHPGLLLLYDRPDRLRLDIRARTEMRLFCLTRPAGITLAAQYGLTAPGTRLLARWKEPWDILRRALVCARSSEPKKQKLCNHYARLWLSLVENEAPAANGQPEESAVTADERLLAAALAHIESRLERWRAIDELASALHCSREHLCRVFTRQLGRGPWEEIRRRQLHLAEEILRGGGETIVQVAERLGYSDRYAFAKAFRKLLGYPPGQATSRAKRPAAHA